MHYGTPGAVTGDVISGFSVVTHKGTVILMNWRIGGSRIRAQEGHKTGTLLLNTRVAK